MTAESFVQDIRSGVRSVRRHPGFALIAIAMLAVGIGANAAIFSVVDAAFLKPLPYPETDRLTLVTSRYVHAPDTYSVSYLDMRDVADQSPNLSDFALYLGWQSVNLSGRGTPHRLPAVRS